MAFSDFRLEFQLSFFFGYPILAVCLVRSPPVLLFGAMNLTVPFDFCFYAGEGGVDVGFLQLTFPDDNHRPTLGLYLAPDLLVAGLVSRNLCGPEVGISLGNRIVLASLVAVPEAAVDEDYGPVFREDNIW